MPMNQVIEVRNIGISDVGGNAVDFPAWFRTKSVTRPLRPNSNLVGFWCNPKESSKSVAHCSPISSEFVRQYIQSQPYIPFGKSNDSVGDFGRLICLWSVLGGRFASLVILGRVFDQLVINERRKGFNAVPVLRASVRHWNPNRSLL
jgi:hypothetical protein